MEAFIMGLFLLCIQLLPVQLQSWTTSPSPAPAGDPNLKLRITTRGLDYANQIASQIINDKVRQLHIPDIDGGNIKAKNIIITDFRPPTYTYRLEPPNTLSWGFNGAAIGLAAEVHACKWIIARICIKVDASVYARGVRIMMTAPFGSTPEGRPVIREGNTSFSIENLSLDISGGHIIGWIISLFEDKIARRLKIEAEKQIYNLGNNFLMNTVNAKLATFPVNVTLGKHFDLDYGLESDPVMDPGYLEVPLKGNITLIGSQEVSPYSPTPLSSFPADKMMFVWLSDKIFNDLSYFGHVDNLTRAHIDKNDPKIGPFLKLHCDPGTVCLGKLLPELVQIFPQGTDSVDMNLNTTEPPFLNLSSDGTANLTIDGTMEWYTMIGPGQKFSALMASLAVESRVYVTIKNMALVGQVDITTLELVVLESKLSPETVKALEIIFPTFGKRILENKINQVLETGLPIPVIEGIKLINPQIRILDRTLQVESDVQFG